MSTNQGTKKRKCYDGVDGKECLQCTFLEEELMVTKTRLAEAEKEIQHLKSLKSEDDDKVTNVEDDPLANLDMNDTWNVRYMELREYLQMNGDCKVPCKYDKNLKLGMWVFNQRKNYVKVKEGKKGGISQERIVLLNGLGFHWGKKFPQPVSWDEHFEEPKKHQETFGDCNKITSGWVKAQRVEYQRKKKGQSSLLTLDQIKKLNEIGFKWKARRQS